MNQLMLLVTGDNVVGKAQRVHFTPGPNFPANLRRLSSEVDLDPPEATITGVAVWDPEFEEYVRVTSFDELPKGKAKIRVTTNAPANGLNASAAGSAASPVPMPPADESLQSTSSRHANAALAQMLADADAAVAAEVERVAGTEAAAAVRARQESLRAITAAVARGEIDADDAKDALRAASSAPTPRQSTLDKRFAGSAAPAAAASPSAGDYESAPARRKAAPPPRKATAPSGDGDRAADATPEPTTPQPERSRPVNPMDSEAVAPRTPGGASATSRGPSVTSPGSARRRREPLSPRGGANSPMAPRAPTIARASSPHLGLTDSGSITVFCVYNGAMAQRAKAVRVKRQAPDVEGILRTLREKFRSELALGYVEIDTGAFVEIADAEHLAEIIDRDCRDADSITLQCWKPDGLGDAAVEEPDDTRASRTLQIARQRRAPSTAGQSVGSRMDVSGAAYSEEQLRELFEELDLDGSGYLDIDEFRRYFYARFDDMGINDIDKKFEKMLNSTTGFDDGQLDFDEFAIIMLKLAQW